MSNLLAYIEQNPQESKRLIGLEYEQLQQLTEQAQLLHRNKQLEIEKTKVRIIKGGGGRKAKLSINEQIILTLVYLHHLPTFQMLGIKFGVSESTANNIFHYWSELLRELLPASLLEQVKIIVTPNGQEIVDVTVGKPGPTSDINIWRESQSKLGYSQRFKGDKAYLGEPQIETPHKKRKHQEISSEEKEKNRQKASQRIFVEHVIRLVKIFRVAQERFRLRMENYQKVILTICGLVRLRIGTLCLK